MTYRDRPLDCPRCKVALVRRENGDLWTCSRCDGALIAVEHVIRELVEIAPDLAPASRRAVDLSTPGRRATEPALTCTSCERVMEPVFLGGVDADRCVHDQLLWFDAGEHSTVLARADEQRRDRRRSWLARLLD